jgi:predicted enzyme related to lactoylglutathione lyase
MLRGLTTVSFYADDLETASRWYAEFLGIEPYFRVPGYVEFRIGDYEDELGIIDRKYAPPGASGGPGGQIVFWHVDDLAGTVDRLTDLGAVEYEPVRDRGHGFVTASVVDPFGNVLGVMTNPHYLDVLAARST